MWIWSLPFVALLLHVAYARHRTEGVYGDWSHLLGLHARHKVDQLETEVELTAVSLEETFATARERRARARDEAQALLDAACVIACEATDDRLERLETVGRLIRMLSAALPVPPLMPRAFRLRQLASLAGIATVLHHILVTTPERLALRVGFLRWGFRLVRRVMKRSSATAGSQPAAQAPWDRFEAAVADFQVLDREHVEAVRVFLTSLAAFPKPEVRTT